jgi:peptidylprolyl isomerase
MLRSLLSCALLVPWLVGCGEDAGENPDNGDPTKVTYAESLNVDLSTMQRTLRGVYYRDEPAGTGAEAVALRRVRVHYDGFLPNGRRFDSSRDGVPFTFSLGAGQVIDGWDEGIAGMRVGGRRKLVIPASLGYGEDGVPGVIPPYSVLVFDTELISVD